MKKIISLLITLAMVIACLPVAVYAEDATVTLTGSGTSTDPYQIATADQLNLMRDLVNGADTNATYKSAYYELTADIDLNGQEWEPIGYNATYLFDGKFDGKGHVVKNFKITEAHGKYIAFFGHVGGYSTTAISNLGIEDMTITQTISLNGLAGMAARGGGQFKNCYIKDSSFNSTTYSLGLFMDNLRNQTSFENCYVYNCSVTGLYDRVLSGFTKNPENAQSASFTNCYVANIDTDLDDRSVIRPFGYTYSNTKETNAVHTLTNCWSELVYSVDDGYTGASTEYRESVTCTNNQGATKEGIITALVDNGGGGYVVDRNVNNGYPCLAFEKKALVPATAFAGGDGKTAATAYQIATAEQLAYMRNLVNGADTNATYGNKYYELTADIDLDGEEWEPIGYNGTYMFSGKFDGNGHVVKNFKITKIYGKFLAFFGHVSNTVEISNLGIENEVINYTDTSTTPSTAGFVVRGGGKFTNCYVKNSTIKTVKGSVGGFMHSLRGAGTFENCYVYNCDVTVPDGSNGIAGFALSAENGVNSSFTNCYVADVTTTRTNIYILPFSIEWSTNKYNNDTSENKNGYVTHTLTNCWSTMKYHLGTTASAETSKVVAKLYPDAVTCADNDEATKDQISAAFKGVAGYQINPDINGGYPALSFEKAPVDTDYVVAAIVPGDQIYVKLIEKTAVSGATVYVATYDSYGRLLGADVATVASPYEFTTDLSSEGAYQIKVFVWNTNQTPLADAYEGKFIDGELINVDELSYSVNNGIMTVEYANAIADYASFADTPWGGETAVTKIVLGNNVTGIGDNAFSGFTNLESVEIPKSVATISDTAFPNTDFTIYGYANGAAEAYADENGNKFQLKRLRILTIGNSHTSDHGQWNKEILGDIKDAGIETEIVYQRVTNGGFKMYYEDTYVTVDGVDYSKSHYAQANNPDSPYYARYAAQLDNYEWDIVLIQDYRESGDAKADFTDAMAETMKWLRAKQPTAKIGWIVDWNDKNYGTTDRAVLQQKFYDNTVATVNKVKAMTSDAPDIIIPMGTAMQNVRTTYLWDVNNAADCYTKYGNTDWCGSAEKIVTYNLLERDGTHCSYELGRYIMGAAVFGYIYDLYQDKLIGGDSVDFCDALKTMPVTTGEDEWKGEFTASIWDIVEETTENTIANPWTITNSVYTVDPAIAMAEAVENATYSDFTAAGIVNTIKALGNGFTVTEDDVTIDGDTATVRFLYGYSEKTVTISK